MTLRRNLWGAVQAGAALLAATEAHADGWQEVELTSPYGKPASAITTAALDDASAHLALACERDGDGRKWRGVLVWRDGAPAPVDDESAVVVGFFERAPVTERWRSERQGERVVHWPAPAESLEKKLLREAGTRGRAVVTLELREDGRTPVRFAFALKGLAEHAATLDRTCGASAGAARPRRERGW